MKEELMMECIESFGEVKIDGIKLMRVVYCIDGVVLEDSKICLA